MACDWKYAIRTVERFKRAHPEAKIPDIRFEDLIENPEAVLDNICHFIGVPYEKGMLDFYYSNSTYENQRRFARQVKGIHKIAL